MPRSLEEHIVIHKILGITTNKEDLSYKIIQEDSGSAPVAATEETLDVMGNGNVIAIATDGSTDSVTIDEPSLLSRSGLSVYQNVKRYTPGPSHSI